MGDGGYPHTPTADPTAVPTVGLFAVGVRPAAAANSAGAVSGSNEAVPPLRNAPPACAPAVEAAAGAAGAVLSPPLTGDFGPSNLALDSLLVSLCSLSLCV